jgi:hypothetical protein
VPNTVAEENKKKVRLTDGVSSEEVEIDLKTESEENLKFLWEVIKSEEARQELKLRTGLDPAKNFSSSTKEDIEYFIEWAENNPEKYEELYGHLEEKYGI